jgi:hypothetical protein
MRAEHTLVFESCQRPYRASGLATAGGDAAEGMMGAAFSG